MDKGSVRGMGYATGQCSRAKKHRPAEHHLLLVLIAQKWTKLPEKRCLFAKAWRLYPIIVELSRQQTGYLSKKQGKQDEFEIETVHNQERATRRC